MIFDGQEILIAVAAGDAERRSAHLHVRSRNLALIDGIAEVDIGVPARADIANGGEAGEQGGAGIGDALDGLFRVRLGQLEVGVEVGRR